MPNLLELPGVLRAAGLEVTTLPGWETRTISGAFTPDSVVWHHDASPRGDSPGVPEYMRRNYGTAGAQLWVDRRGRWTVISCRKAAHAGKVLTGKPGNSDSYGIETDHTTGEDWPAEQLAGLRIGTVAILRWLQARPDDLEFHRTVCYPTGRKSDPDGLDLATERRILALLWSGAKNLTSNPVPNLDQEDDLFTDTDRADLQQILKQQGRTGPNGEWQGWKQLGGLTLVDAVAKVLQTLTDPITSGVEGSTTKMTPRETWRNADAYGYRVQALLAAQSAAISTLSSVISEANDLDVDEITAAVQKAVADAVVKVDVTVKNSQEIPA